MQSIYAYTSKLFKPSPCELDNCDIDSSPEVSPLPGFNVKTNAKDGFTCSVLDEI